MKFIYGKNDLKTLARAQENCYLLTNGMGGFSSCTMAGSVSRNDHAFLMACVQAPNFRINMIHRLQESLEVEGEVIALSSQQFSDGSEENGLKALTSFSFEDYPQWFWQTGGVEIQKRIGMKQGENTAAVIYEITNRSRRDCMLRVVPYLQFTPKGTNLEKEQEFTITNDCVCSAGYQLYFKGNGTFKSFPLSWEEYYYDYDDCDGRRATGLAAANHCWTMKAAAGESVCLELVYSTDPVRESAFDILEDTVQERTKLAEQAGFSDANASVLAKAAGQFISYRSSTGQDTILAGYPFFEDWGRDTMIALAGCCISTCRFEQAKSILRTFMKYQRRGLMPNLFPEGGKEPMYNTVDAALLFVNSVYLYCEKSCDMEFLKEAYPAMKEVVRWYRRGTDFAIRMDTDGLISAGNGLDQVTWMDVRVGEILPTPRHGKPVEINAYWYNVLKIMELYAAKMGEDAAPYGELAKLVRRSFNEKFWMEDKQCLKDVLSDTAADEQIRCNQIWAVSMPFAVMDRSRECAVVNTVFEKLYTPYGLRTLEESDAQFHPFYGGEMMERDLAYHQGTVWTFPLGGYYLAYLKVNDFSETAKQTVRLQLEVMEAALREGCIGQLPEIYDGENPTRSKGCFAQAWSVGEILRVYEALEV